GELTVSTGVTVSCYAILALMSHIPSELISFRFHISIKNNKLVAIDCDIIGFFNGSVFSLEKTYVSRCI
ncbi:hypothetical protein SO802_010819, partial [Lithocarpus litseifolius]